MRPRFALLATGLLLTIMASAAQAAPPLPLPVGVVLENGGAGPTYDATAYRGKFFPQAPTGTIVEVCAFFEKPATTADLGIMPLPDASNPTFHVTITSVAPGWNCDQGSHQWAASSLFVYKRGGNAAIGGGGACPGDSRAGWEGLFWYEDACIRRGYRVRILEGVDGPSSEAPIQILANGGDGPEFRTDVGGKLFRAVPEGTITLVCAFFRDASTVLDVGAKPLPNQEPDRFHVTIESSASGWNCASVHQAWSANTLFVYAAGGNAAIGAASGQPDGDSWARYGGWGTPYWAQEYYVKRGYMVVLQTNADAGVGTDATIHVGDAASVRLTANLEADPQHAAAYAGDVQRWAGTYQARFEAAAAAATAGNVARLANEVLDLPNARPPTPTIVASDSQDGLLRLRSDFDPAAPRTPHCYGVETHDGTFDEPIQGCYPFLP